ncbi:hypothetical protein OAK74_01140 [bacterium]|jgi:ABC-type nitrate/sulfonate/bicarbonate transport system permease component|nr:hypothetical protein [Verrucomicrobiales bacterium]MDB2496818.1 hypothetical protein [Verrucomicrobiales bacterium]MDB3940550.1 hypothetical protein [Verrucomicrobiales bacterium]MDC0251861.1 hypothetical protein [bacterium]
MIKSFFQSNWRGKLASLLVAIAIWYLIKSHLDAENPTFPVPGTTTAPVPRSTNGPNLDDTLLGPLAPPVPGNDAAN